MDYISVLEEVEGKVNRIVTELKEKDDRLKTLDT
jgi:hypothetical protein